MTVLAVASPSAAHAAGGPARLSVGLSTNYLSWKVVSDREGDRLSGSDAAGIGLALSVELHPLIYVQAEVSTPYEVDAKVATASGQEGVLLEQLQFLGGNVLALSRPFGRTAVSPTLGVGLAYRHITGGSYVRYGADDSGWASEVIVDDQFQGIAAAGLSWNSGWDAG